MISRIGIDAMAGRVCIFTLTLLTAALAFQFFVLPVVGQGYHGKGHDDLHHWYMTLKDWRGRSCCNMQDCRPTQSRFRDQDIEVMVDGEWTTVPPYKVLPLTSPDLRTHVCSPGPTSNYPRGHIFCVVLGSGV